MAKYTNVARFRVKSGKQQEFESVFSKAETWGGQYCISQQKLATKLTSHMVCGKASKKLQMYAHK